MFRWLLSLKLVHHGALELKTSLWLEFIESYKAIQYVRLKIYIPMSRIHTTVNNMKACVRWRTKSTGAVCFVTHVVVTNLPGCRVTDDVGNQGLPLLTLSCYLQDFSGTQSAWNHFLDVVYYIFDARSSHQTKILQGSGPLFATHKSRNSVVASLWFSIAPSASLVLRVYSY